MARIVPIQMALDSKGNVTYAVAPPNADANLAWSTTLAANTAQSVTLPLTPDSNTPWQVFLRYKNPNLSSMVWVAYTGPGVGPVTPDLPDVSFANVNSVLEPPAWVVPGASTLSFISANIGDEVSLIAYLGTYGNPKNV